MVRSTGGVYEPPPLVPQHRNQPTTGRPASGSSGNQRLHWNKIHLVQKQQEQHGRRIQVGEQSGLGVSKRQKVSFHGVISLSSESDLLAAVERAGIVFLEKEHLLLLLERKSGTIDTINELTQWQEICLRNA